MSEPLTRLAELPSAEPDASRAEHIRVRCRTRLARQAPRTPASRGVALDSRAVRLWQPLTVALGIGYVAEVIIQALSVYGLL